MPIYSDQTKQRISLATTPQRIISLVPSQTELLFDLGMTNEVVGITKFCIHPDQWFRSKARIGGTKKLNIKLIQQLKPDLVIANKEENVKEQVEELQKEFPVWTSDINNLEDALEMITKVGIITGKQQTSQDLADQIKESFAQLQTPTHKLQTAYLIWKDPYMTIGGDTFINDMLSAAGFENIFSNKKRYPEITISDLQRVNCQLLLLSSEPFPFKQKHIDELQAFLPNTKILLADGEMFSWYGSRLLKAPAYFRSLHKQIK